MTKNIYTPHKADRFYDENNMEIKDNRYYADNYYEAKYPERRFYKDAEQERPSREVPERGYAYRAPREPEKKSHVGLVLASVAITLVAAVSVGAIVFFATKDNNKLTAAPKTTVATTASNAAAAPADAPAQIAQEATKAPDPTPEEATGTSDAAYSVAQRCYAGHNLEKTAEENVVRVDGERVYMDVKRLAPEGTGSPAHFYANGMTSYGFDWNYKADNSNFVLACNYNFDRQQYDFTFYGTQPGVAHVTVYYNTGDNVQVPVQLTINVDDNLNVTQG